MKRKRWFAMILVLGLLIPLMPLSFASATELAPGQIIPDGIYYIRNTLSEDYLKALRKYDYQDNQFPSVGLSVNGYHVFHEDYSLPNSNAQNIDASLNAAFLWRITYIGDGRYSIFSVFDTSLVLAIDPISQVNDTPIICAYQYPDAGYYRVPEELTWRITQDANGYVLQNDSIRRSALAIEHNSNSDEPYVVMDRYDVQIGECHWELIAAPEQIFFHTTRGIFYENPVCYVAPEETLTLEELGLRAMLCRDVNAMQQIRWESSDYDIAIVDDFDGTVIGVSYGQCTITATYTKNGQTVSNSYTLKVAPLPAGEYYIKNMESENFIDSLKLGTFDERQLVLNTESTGLRSQKWTLVHIQRDEYYILLEIDNRQFYLTPADGELLENGASIVLNLVEQNSVIPRWQIGVTEDGNHTIMNTKNRSLFMQCSEDDEGNILQGTSTTDNDYEKWVFERAKTLRVQVYFDPYVNAYAPHGTNGDRFIEDNHLAIARQYYWEQFRVSIEFTRPQAILTYYEECSNKNEKGECECSRYCYNSDDIDQLQNVHHTNISNILLRVPVPQDPIDVSLLFIGHPTCYAYDSTTCGSLLLGLAYRQYGLIAVNNIGLCPNSVNGVCMCPSTINCHRYVVESSVKTLIHEIGHIFGAKDHYGGLFNDSHSTSQMHIYDKGYYFYYNENCIYGENKEESNVLHDFMMCEACRRNVQDGIERYFDFP